MFADFLVWPLAQCESAGAAMKRTISDGVYTVTDQGYKAIDVCGVVYPPCMRPETIFDLQAQNKLRPGAYGGCPITWFARPCLVF